MWTLHFQRMAEGKRKPNHNGQYVVDKIRMGGAMKGPNVNLVTPVAHVVEQAKTEVARKRQHIRIEISRKGYLMHGPPRLRD